MCGEGVAVNLTKRGEPLRIVTPEVTKDRLVSVETGQLTDDLDGEEFGVVEHRGGITLPTRVSVEAYLHMISIISNF